MKGVPGWSCLYKGLVSDLTGYRRRVDLLIMGGRFKFPLKSSFFSLTGIF